MKIVLDVPVLIAYNPSTEMGAYVTVSDSEDIFLSEVIFSASPISNALKNMAPQPLGTPLGTILNPSFGWRFLESGREYLGLSKPKNS